MHDQSMSQLIGLFVDVFDSPGHVQYCTDNAYMVRLAASNHVSLISICLYLFLRVRPISLHRVGYSCLALQTDKRTDGQRH